MTESDKKIVIDLDKNPKAFLLGIINALNMFFISFIIPGFFIIGFRLKNTLIGAVILVSFLFLVPYITIRILKKKMDRLRGSVTK